MKEKTYYLSIIIIFIIILYLSSFYWLFIFLVDLMLYWSLSFLFYSIYKILRKKEKLNYKDYLIIFIKKFSLSSIILILLFLSFWYYQNSFYPATMTQYTISNWEKIVIFQEMTHIGSSTFYQKVKENLTNYKKQWYVYFFEWVKSWTKQNSDKFNNAMWINFDKDLYKNFSKLYWVIFQDNTIYYNLVNNLDFNIDVSIDYIVNEYEKNIKLKKNSIPNNKKQIINPNIEIIKLLDLLNEKQLKVLIFINKSILNTLIKNDWALDFISNNYSNQELLNIILDWRNKILTQEIINSEYKKIYVTYWKLHFKWVLNLLQKNNKKWKIIDEKYIIAFGK